MDVTFPEYAFEAQDDLLKRDDLPKSLQRQADAIVSDKVLPKTDEPNRM